MDELIEAIRCRLNPQRFFIDYIRGFRRGGVEILLTGTLHNEHCRSVAVGLGMFSAIIEYYSPQLVMIEARVQDLCAEKIAWSPVEMAFIWDYCVRTQRRCVGIDFWEDYSDMAARGQKIDYNSPARNRRMLEALLAAVPPAGKVLVALGYSHVEPITTGLLAAGFVPEATRVRQIGEVVKAGHPTIISPSFKASLASISAWLGTYLITSGNTSWTRRLRRKHRFLQQLLFDL